MRAWGPNPGPVDPSKDPEILHWFHTLGPPPVGQAPPDLHAKVRARVEQHRPQRGVFAWVPRMATPAWATALAMVLVLSVGLNVWWGIQGFGRRSHDARQRSESSLGEVSAAGRLLTYQFQAAMAQPKALGTIVAAHPASQEPAAVVGFTPQAARTAFFRIGTLYAEALAALQGGAVEVAVQRLNLLEQALASVQAPRVLAQYLGELKLLLQSRRQEDAVVAQFLALFEPLYESAYARPEGPEGLLLFRAGAWLENMYLAAASGDAAALRRGGQTLQGVSSALARLNAPRGVLAAFERMQLLLAHQPLIDREISAIRTLVQDIQGLLNA